MRIIAGTAKGARLAPVPEGTRPLSDRAREGLFSSLGGRVVGARVLDLFAGTGAMSLEALSRGAASAVLVDASPTAVAAIEDNLTRTGLDGEVVHADAARFLARPSGGWDLVLLDPPWDHPEPDLRDILVALEAHVATGGTVALTRPKRASTDVIPVNLQVVKHLDYGETRILVLEAR
ncbi:MAG TPA: RsmD family RNA methyltransferase [Actinomycetota bacterium]|nr:RsmD family RNA methyltransferase [Actinomycetota bacterium]